MALFFKLFLLLVGVGILKGCSECDFPHPQERFCEAPYVIRATVVSSRVLPRPKPDSDRPRHRMLSQWPINYLYELAINHVYKSSETHNFAAVPFVMYASFGPGFCGFPPGDHVGKEFLIFGKPLTPEDAGSLQPQITTCGNTIPWDEVMPRDRDLIGTTYGPACQECKIQRDCLNPEYCSDDTCVWDVGTNFMDLCLRDKVCKKMENGRCDWTEKCHEDVPAWMRANQGEAEEQSQN